MLTCVPALITLCNPNEVMYPTLAMLLKACKRKPPIVSLRHRRLPITTDVLYKICAVFNGGYVLTWRDKLMCAACTLAFFAFMRCGEFTVRGSSSAELYLCIDDVDFSSSDGYMNVFLRSSKADPFKRGCLPQYMQMPRPCAQFVLCDGTYKLETLWSLNPRTYF
jgi:hypothetical protein